MNNEKRNPLIALLAGGGGGGGGGSSLLVARAEISAQAFEQGGEIPLTLDKTYAQLAEAGVNSAIDLAVMMDMGSGEQQIGSIWCHPVFAEDMEVYDMQFMAYTGDVSFMGMTAFVQVAHTEGADAAMLVLSETGSNSDIVKANLFIWLSQTGGVWTADKTFDYIKAEFNGNKSLVTLNVYGQLWGNGLYTHDNFFADTWYHNTNDPVLGGEVIRLTGSFVEDGHLVAVSIVAQDLNGTKTVTVDVDVHDIAPLVLVCSGITDGTTDKFDVEFVPAVRDHRPIVVRYTDKENGYNFVTMQKTHYDESRPNDTTAEALIHYYDSLGAHLLLCHLYIDTGSGGVVKAAADYFTLTPET